MLWRIVAVAMIFVCLAILADARERVWIRIKKEWIVGGLVDRNTCEPFGKNQLLCHDVVFEYAAYEVVKR